MPTDPQSNSGLFQSEAHRLPGSRSRRIRALTLVEVMMSMLVLSMVMMAYLGTFLQSRRLTESAVLHAAATSMIYGLIEQIKTIDYTDSLPYLGNKDPVTGLVTNPNATDDKDPNNTKPPFIKVRISQSQLAWLKVVYTPAPDKFHPPAPKGPLTTPGPTVLANDIGAVDNYIGSIPLSTVTGTASQQINLNLWVWIDEVPDTDKDVFEVKKVTIVYSYDFIDGGKKRSVRDREVFLRTHYEQ